MIDLLMTDPKAEPRTNPMTELLANSMLVRFPTHSPAGTSEWKKLWLGMGIPEMMTKYPISSPFPMSTLNFFLLEVWKEKLPAYWGTGFPTHFQEQVSRRTWLIPCLTAAWPYNEYPTAKLMSHDWPVTNQIIPTKTRTRTALLQCFLYQVISQRWGQIMMQK